VSKPHGLPEHLTKDAKRLKHVVFSGNPHVGVPFKYGWVLRLNRCTTDEERAWLNANGWTSAGGKWCKPDEEVE